MIWSEQQRQMLVAMGYQPMLHGRLEVAAEPARASDPEPAARAGTPPRPPARHAAPTAAAPMPAAGDTAALEAALRRAAGGADVAALVKDLGRLRREPALKRALWPSLRALRRGA